MPTHSGVSPLAIILSIRALNSVERRRHLVALRLPDARHVPDERLEVGLERARRTACRRPGRRAAVAVVPVRVDAASTSSASGTIAPSLANRRACRAAGRCRCRRVAAFDLGVDVRFPVGVTGVLDRDADRVTERLQGVLNGGDRRVVTLGAGDVTVAPPKSPVAACVAAVVLYPQVPRCRRLLRCQWNPCRSSCRRRYRRLRQRV